MSGRRSGRGVHCSAPLDLDGELIELDTDGPVDIEALAARVRTQL